MSINLTIILGNKNSRKSSTIRALTGLGRRGICQIELDNHIPNLKGSIIDFYVRISSLQESGESPEIFIQEIELNKYENILIPLWIDQLNDLPNGKKYIDIFVERKCDIKEVIVLGSNKLPYDIPIAKSSIYYLPDSKTTPNNRNIKEIKKWIKWI